MNTRRQAFLWQNILETVEKTALEAVGGDFSFALLALCFLDGPSKQRHIFSLRFLFMKFDSGDYADFLWIKGKNHSGSESARKGCLLIWLCRGIITMIQNRSRGGQIS